MTPPERRRQRVDGYSFTEHYPTAADVRSRRSAFLASLDRDVSPPGSPALLEKAELNTRLQLEPEAAPTSNSANRPNSQSKTVSSSRPRIVPSAFKLTRIRDLPANANVDTISIRDILGDVMLKEVWFFDFLYDVDWVM
jgi:tyrosyl-DNA phosphodiesterase 1